MRVAVIYLEKKFIVVIPENSSVADLKTEIERVHCALFQSSGPPQPVTEIQTLSGCVLYGGYTISSVLSDNDTVIASGAGGVTPSTGDGHTNSPRLCAYTSPSQLSFCGYNPLGYYSPLLGAHMLNYGHLGGSPYTPPQSRVLQPPLETSRLSLFQSPSAKTVGSQCPSPESIRGTTPQSQPRQSNSERERDSDRIEHTASAEESESPLGDLSHFEGKATPQTKILFSTSAPTPSDSSDGTVAVTGVRKRKRTPRSRTQDPKKKPAKETKTTKSDLEGGVERNSEVGKEGEAEGQKELVEVVKEKSVSVGDTDAALPEGITEQSTTSKPPPQFKVDESVAKSVPSDSSPSSPFILGIESSNRSNVQDSVLSPQSPLAKKRKLSKSAEISEGTVTTKGGGKQMKKKTKKAASKARTPPGDDTDSSGWATTVDESEGEVVKEKKAPSSKGKRLKAVAVERVSKSTTHKENSDKEKPASTNDSSSEWETDDDDDTESTPVEPATSVSSATQTSLDRSQNNDNTKAAKPRKKPKPVTKEATPADSSSGWTTDEDEAEMDSKSQVEDRASQPAKKKDSKVTKSLEKIASSTSGEKRKAEGRNSEKSNEKEKKKEKSDSESEKGGSQSEKLLETWNQFSSPSPVKRYSAHDGRRLRHKKLEDLKHCSEVTEKVTADNTGSVSGSNESTADTFAQKRVEETAVNLDPVEKDGEVKNNRHEGGEDIYKDDIERYVEANGSSRETEVLVPNSLPSDEEMELETLSKSHGHADEITVIEDSQESQEIHKSSRSPSPEIPLLSRPSNPSHQPSFTARQKMQDNVTLKNSLNSPSANGSRVKDGGNAESDGMKKKKKKKNESAKHTDSEADLVASDGWERKKKKKKKNRGDNDNKSTSDNAAESSDATISGASEPPQKRKSSHSSPQKPSKENLTEAGAPPSQSQSEDGSNEREKSRAKRKKRKREVKVLSSQDHVPSSQTDQSEGEGALVIDCDDLMSETENLGSTKSKSQCSGNNTVEENSSQETAIASDSQQSCGERKKLKKKKKRKNMSTLATAETASGEDGDEQTTATRSAAEPSVRAAKDADLTENEDLGERTTTDTDVIDLSSDCSVTTMSQSGKTKRRKKHKKKEATLPQAQKITKVMTRNKPPPSEENGGKTSHEDDSTTEDDDVSRNGGSSSQKTERSKDGFLKPAAIPPSKVSPKPPKVQLSPAAGITSSTRVSPGKVKSGTPKESSLLSVFSVTETEVSSEESSSEKRVKPTSRASHEKKARKLNFLSSLGSHGKKVHAAKPSALLSRSSLLTPSPSSRFSSESAVRMFSLSHSPRGSARRVRPRISPSNIPPPKRKHVEDSLGASLDELLKETQGSGKEGGGRGSGKVSVSDLLADGSLWDT